MDGLVRGSSLGLGHGHCTVARRDPRSSQSGNLKEMYTRGRRVPLHGPRRRRGASTGTHFTGCTRGRGGTPDPNPRRRSPMIYYVSLPIVVCTKAQPSQPSGTRCGAI
ncbi:hypothetical protein CGRA01v4_06877 [Colletotrichum graminicola]|nr:hypothetical protein CGRA01v4_06877 [Colletotrichum graminicola]